MWEDQILRFVCDETFWIDSDVKRRRVQVTSLLQLSFQSVCESNCPSDNVTESVQNAKNIP